jgi:hypothetical protein
MQELSKYTKRNLKSADKSEDIHLVMSQLKELKMSTSNIPADGDEDTRK